MKKNIKTLSALPILAFLLLTSCMSSQGFLLVRGTGAPADRNYNVSDFNGIRVSDGFDVILVQDNTEGVTITAQENLFEYITVEVTQGILNIYTSENVMATKSMKARISYKLIDNLKVSGGGDVTSDNPLDVPQLGIEISGGGDMTAEVKTGDLKCRMSGGGDAAIRGSANIFNIEMSGGGDLTSLMNVNNVSCHLSGGGDLKLISNTKIINADIEIGGGGDLDAEMQAEKVSCTVSGGGDASLNGQSSDLEINVSGGGDIHADSFAAGSAKISANGGSDIYVNVSHELTGQISGGGDIYYSGNPDKVTIDARGGSKIHKQ